MVQLVKERLVDHGGQRGANATCLQALIHCNGVPGLLDALADELSSMLKGFRLIRSMTCVHDSRQHDVKRLLICPSAHFRTNDACAATGRGGWLQIAHRELPAQGGAPHV